jgi:hypothetical protein
MASESMGRRRFSTLAEECESLWLLHMEADYIGFMVSIETEIRLLEHIDSCRACMDKLAEVYNKVRDPADELEELFAVDLLVKLAGKPESEDCPVRDDFSDADVYIKARISWRVKKLKKLLSDAELELDHLSGRIMEEGKKSTLSGS